MTLTHEFSDYIPKELNDGTLYISIRYKTCSHLCFCGCGSKVVTPLSPNDWELIYNGSTVSLHPSIGNWNERCKSHYWIKEDKVVWSYRMSDAEIQGGRRADRKRKEDYYRLRDENDQTKLGFFASLAAKLARK